MRVSPLQQNLNHGMLWTKMKTRQLGQFKMNYLAGELGAAKPSAFEKHAS